MKCFWCYRLAEEGTLPYVEIQDAAYVYKGESTCEGHLDVIRRVGPGPLLREGLMS